MDEELQKLMAKQGITIQYGFDGKPQYTKKGKVYTPKDGKAYGDIALLHSKTANDLKHKQTRSGVDDFLSHPLTNLFVPATSLYTAGSKAINSKNSDLTSIGLDLLGAIPAVKGVGLTGQAFLKSAKVVSTAEDVAKLKDKKKKKYALGGTAMNMDSPQEALFKMIRATEESELQASSDPLVAGLKGLGSMMTNTGMSMIGSGLSKSGDMSGTGGFLQDNFGAINSGVSGLNTMGQKFNQGGQVSNPDIEVEGNELFETPQGQVGEFNGPSHEEGGIPLRVKPNGIARDGEVPGGTYIYPDSIKIGGKSLATRKKLREKKETNLSDLLGDSADKILKNTLSRVKRMNQIEDVFDRTIQDKVKGQNQSEAESFKYGGDTPSESDRGIPPMVRFDAPPKYVPSVDDDGSGYLDILKNFEMNGAGNDDDFRYFGDSAKTSNTSGGFGDFFNSASLPTAGDAMGMFGNLYQAYKPKSLTMKNRAGDTPNINPYENYGTEALNTLEGNKDLLGQINDVQMQRLASNRNASISRNNNSARGINTQRALNLATDSQMTSAEGDLMAKYAEQLLGVNNQIASTELDVSGKKAQGEHYRDLSDRQDRDAFFTNLSKDEAAVGEAWSRTGKAANQIKKRGTEAKFLNEMFDNVPCSEFDYVKI